jgi:hypothetical protein
MTAVACEKHTLCAQHCAVLGIKLSVIIRLLPATVTSGEPGYNVTEGTEHTVSL